MGEFPKGEMYSGVSGRNVYGGVFLGFEKLSQKCIYSN